MHENQEQITPLAITNWRDIRQKFGIKQKNRRGHMYIIGKTGTGKSSLLGNMAISDIANGYGLALIDPHGDLAETLLQYIPENRIDDVIYFNPGDLEYPIAFNPLENTHADFHHLVVSGLISTFKKIWADFWGPRLEHILRHCLFTLVEYPGSTLLDITRLLTDKDFRQKVVLSIKHPHVKSFWIHEFESYSAWLRSESISPILNKMGQFLTNLPLRNIIGQSKNTFRFRKAMDEGKIIIVNLSKGKLGEDNCTLLGSMIVTQIYLAAFSRSNIAEDQRRPFYMYVDEFHNFITHTFADMLSESRKYGLNLVLAHQYINQLTDQIRNAVFGNAGTMISFRVGSDDAMHLEREFSPFNSLDLVSLSNYSFYIKLMINGITSEPFSAVTLPLPITMISELEYVREESRRKYCTPRKMVELTTLYRLKPLTHPRRFQGKLF